MSTKLTLNVPVNRVEGDLEIRTTVEDNVCKEAWCIGTMFRGFERILQGRGALDGLVITPRICGICSTGHLTAATKALENLADITPPAKAIALRNVALMTEHLQSDVRQSILTFATDFTHSAYQKRPLYAEAFKRYEPFKGESFLPVIRESKRILELVAIVGGQWPHSTFMVPGGITSLPSNADILQCELLLERYRKWYEHQILGCSIERWQQVESARQLDEWLDESPAHRESDLGFFIRYGRAIGLDSIGVGTGAFLSVGALDMPEGTKVTGRKEGPTLIPAGFVDIEGPRDFDQKMITEDISHSWFVADTNVAHPWQQDTAPYATGDEGTCDSWCKAPRFDSASAETGPLAEAIVAGNPLFVDLVKTQRPNALTRQLARLVRPAETIGSMRAWMRETLSGNGAYNKPEPITDGEGIGLTHASRGALGHWVRLKDGRIDHYQIITPTAWNASPRDEGGQTGPIETALRGTPVADPDDPIELAHVIRSFDPCLVCTVHRVDADGRSRLKTPLEP